MLDAASSRRKNDTVKFSSEALADVLDEEQTVRLGTWLVRRQLIDRYQLFSALNRSFASKCRLGDAVVMLGYLPRDVVEVEASAHVAEVGSS